MNNNQTQTETKFFDLHTSGIGYLNRLRTVTPNTGNQYLSVTVAALRGNAANAKYTYFDCIVVEEEAKNVLFNLVDTDEDATYMIGFNIGDIYPEPFTYKSGNKQGQTGVSLKGRLIKVKWLRKNNELIYEPQKTSAVEQAAQQMAPDTGTAQTQSAVPPEQAPSNVNQNQTQGNENEYAEVFLSKEDPEFASKKETLKQQGYRWNSERQSWQQPVAA